MFVALRTLTRARPLALPLFGLLVVLVGETSISSYDQRQIIVIAIYTLIVGGLNVSFGFAGELAFGQVAMFAAGAYATGVLANHGEHDILIALLVSVAIAAIVGLISGVPGLRLSLWSLAISSFFLVLLIPTLVDLTSSQSGGLIGLSGITNPTLLGTALTFNQFFTLVIAVAVIWLVIMRNLAHSRVGTSLRVLRESPVLASSLGVSVYRLRIQAYLLGGLPAGAAGALYAYLNGFISPDAFTLDLSIAILAASVVGGSDSIWGAPLGAAILVLGPLQSASFQRYSLLAYGIFLLLVGVLFRSGIAGLLRRLGTYLGVRALGAERLAALDGPLDSRAGTDAAGFTINGEALSIVGISKKFGGNAALNDASLSANPRHITAILGANGAGKTTLLNTISGFVSADAGSIELGGAALTDLRPHAVAQRGVGRTFQTPIIPKDASVLEVVEAGRLRHGTVGLFASIFRLPKFWRARAEDRRVALQALDFAGLLSTARRTAEDLPLGTRRLLEVVRAVAREPGLILLDEPAAGLDDTGLAELGELMKRSREAGATVVIVEHNVPFVLAIADVVHVMELGRVIASGSPDEIRSNPAVIETYLGRRHATPTASALPGTQGEGR